MIIHQNFLKCEISNFLCKKTTSIRKKCTLQQVTIRFIECITDTKLKQYTGWARPKDPIRNGSYSVTFGAIVMK